MRLLVNGEPREVPEKKVLTDLLTMLGIDDPRGVAVAVNGQVVPRGRWEEFELDSGMKVEVLRAVQGG